MKFYSEVTKEMYDTMSALIEAEDKAKKQNDVEEAAKELKAAVENLAREATEYEKKAKNKEQEAIELEKEFMKKYGADAFRTHLLIPALRESMGDLADIFETKIESMSNVADVANALGAKVQGGARVQGCLSGNDLKDAISKFLDN